MPQARPRRFCEYGTTARDTFSYGCIMLFVATHKWPVYNYHVMVPNPLPSHDYKLEVEYRQEYVSIGVDTS